MAREGSAAMARGAQWRRFERNERRDGGSGPAWKREVDRDAGDERRLWAQRTHASRRAMERFGVTVDARTLRELAAGMGDTLTKPGLMYLGHALDGCSSLWMVIVDGVEMPAVHDPATRQIATFLPWDADQLRFAGGRFVHLVNGGSRQARAYWRAR